MKTTPRVSTRATGFRVAFGLIAVSAIVAQGPDQEPPTRAELRREVESLRVKSRSLEQLLAIVMPLIPNEDLVEVRRKYDALFKRFAEQYRLTDKLWGLRRRKLEQDHARTIARLRAQVRAARAALRSTAGRIGDRLIDIPKTRIPTSNPKPLLVRIVCDVEGKLKGKQLVGHKVIGRSTDRSSTSGKGCGLIS